MNNKVTFRSGLSMAVLSFVFVALLGVQGFAQAGTSTVAGTIFNEQNEVVPGATVTLVSVAQNTRRTAVTNSQGNYSFSLVNPGPYKIEVEAQGFKRAVTSEFQALVDKTTQLPITLEVGGVDVTVTVDTGGIENIVNTQDASLGNNFVSEQIVQLPLEGRNVGDLLSLQAAVTPDGSVAGGRSDQANITLDGIDVNEQQNGPAFTPVLRVTPDSIEEFRVTTSNPDASRGRSSGAQIALVTKAGSNQFRGALYEYHRNTVTTANSYFNNLAGIERPKLIRNLFGGSIGGPIVKDRVFFFYNYEGMRESKEVSVNRLVPLASMGQGQLRYQNTAGQNVTLSLAQLNSLVVPAGGTAPGDVVDMNPLTIALFQSAASRYVANNFQIGDGFNTGGFRFNAPLPVELNTHTARFDWKVTSDEKHTISVRGNYQQDLFANAPAFPDTPGTDTWSHPLGFQVSHTWLISNNLTNRFSYGLTRNAFSDQGDSADNAITFRDVFSPALFARTFSRVTPVQNITNDVNWITGDHTFQFGVNFRIIRNKRTSFAAAFDNGVANSSFYAGAGADLTRAIDNLGAGFEVAPALRLSIQRALTGLIGRLSQYGANFNFQLDGQPQGAGTPVVREWAAEEYDFYAQDSWKIRPNFTLNLGIRYGLSTPVYETQGFQAKPNITLSEYLQRRIDAAEQGQNYTEPLQVILAGKANNAPGFYKMDWDNWQPRISAAWSPNFKSGWLGTIFGTNSESVIRGGFAITNDYFGQALAVNFDGNNRLGFSSNQTISANTYNITTNPAPLYTGSGMAIRTLPGITVPAAATFPQQQPFNDSRRIEGSLDDDLVSPINYSWNVSLGRRMPWGMYVEASYVGRLARNLLAARDVMAPNNLRDPVSGQTYYEAAQALEWHRRNGTPVTQVPNQPFFENMYAPGSLDALFFGTGLSNSRAVYGIMANSRSPGCEPTNPITFGCYEFGTDWTFLQDVFDRFTGNRYFYQRQYGALSAYGTIGSSDYHGATLSVRQRYKGLTWDLNYTFSKSIDDASGLQTSGVYGTAFILNPLRQEDNKAVSDFDLRHVVNVNAIWDVPIGRGRTFFSGMNKIADAFLGGWQFSSIYRWNTGYPSGPYFDVAGWPTNWNVRSNMVQLRPISQTPSRTSGTGGVPNAYTNRLAAYRAFRSPAPGESGDRNQLREPDFWVMDMGLQKAFNMPWNENHKIKIRWDVFNVTNSVQFFGNADPTFGLDPDIVGAPGPSFGNYVGTQGPARVMQFAFRYEF